MLMTEGTVNFFINRLEQWGKHTFLERMKPSFDRFRGYLPAESLTLIPNAPETLSTLKFRGYRLALTTTRKRAELETFLANSGLDEDLFDVIMTRENVRRILPNSEAFLTATERMGLEPPNMLVVSDTDANLRSATAVNMATAGVLSGLSLAGDFQSADLILESVVELSEWL